MRMILADVKVVPLIISVTIGSIKANFKAKMFPHKVSMASLSGCSHLQSHPKSESFVEGIDVINLIKREASVSKRSSSLKIGQSEA